MGRHVKVSHERKLEVLRAGYTVRQAMDMLDVCRSTLVTWSREHGLRWATIEDVRKAKIDAALNTPEMQHKWRSGVSLREIATACDCGPNALVSAAKRLGWDPRPTTYDAAARAAKRRSNVEQYEAKKAAEQAKRDRAAAAQAAAFAKTLEGRILATGGNYAKLAALAKREGGGMTGQQLLMRWHRLRVAA